MGSRVLAALAGLAVAAGARAGGTLEVTIGGQHVGIQRATGVRDPPLPMGDVGLTGLVTAGPLALGLSAEADLAGGSLARAGGSALAGLALSPLPLLRLELLGELGVWSLDGSGRSRFDGARAGLSAKLPALPLRMGLWGLARWGIPGAGGGPAYGVLARVGLDL